MAFRSKLESVTIVSAAPFESEPTLKLLTVAGVTNTYSCVGVGALQSAKNAGKTASVCCDQNVVFIGTAGIFGPFNDIEIVRAQFVEWLPPCVRHGIAYSIPKDNGPYDLPKSLQEFQHLRAAHVICSPTITTLPSFAPKAANPGTVWVENLELFSCFREIIAVAKSFTVLLGITNSVGPMGHTEWQANHHDAAVKTANLFLHLASISAQTNPL